MRIDMSKAVEAPIPRSKKLGSSIVAAANVEFSTNQDYLIKRWIDRDAISMVYGDSNSGKSFFALDLAFHVSAGLGWQGERVRQGKVLYVAAEGGRGFSKRIKAIEEARPQLYHAGKDNLFLLPVQVDLHGQEDAKAIIDGAPLQFVNLLVIDTLAMSMGAGNENDAASMSQFISNINLLKSHFKCHVMIIHHTGKDSAKGARGHSSLRAAVDTEIELTKAGEARLAQTQKQRDMEGGRKAAFTLKVIDLGMDDDLEAITSCIVEPTDPQDFRRKVQLKGFDQVALQALDDALKNHGRAIKDVENFPASRKCVEVDRWREEAVKRGMDQNKTRATAMRGFSRSRESLQEKDITREYDGFVWKVDPDADTSDK